MLVAKEKLITFPVKYPSIKEILFLNNNKPGIKRPYFLSSSRAGIPTRTDDYVEKDISIEEYLIKNPYNTFYVRAAGESMQDVIFDDDLLVVDATRKKEKGYLLNKVVIVCINGDMAVKRYKIIDNEPVFKSENPAYEDIVIKSYDSFRIDGVVTHSIKDIL